LESKNPKKQFFSVVLVSHFEPILLMCSLFLLYDFVLDVVVHLVELFIMQKGQSIPEKYSCMCLCEFHKYSMGVSI